MKLGAWEFPLHLDEVNRAYFLRMAGMSEGQLAADMKEMARSTPDPAAVARLSEANPNFNARLRTTCVATMLEGGHAPNALPQLARATVNCRVMPGETEAGLKTTLAQVLDDAEISITPTDFEFLPSPPSPLTPEVMGAIEKVTREMWPGLPVLPIMSTGATDSRYLRNAGIASYGTSGVFYDIDDNRAHGRDERIRVTSLYDGQEYLYRLVKLLAGGGSHGKPGKQPVPRN